MSLVYITNASLNLISRSLRSKNFKNKKMNFSRKEITFMISNDIKDEFSITEEDLNEFFNTQDLQDMHTKIMINKDFGKFLELIDENQKFITLYIYNQNKKYAYDINAPAYHSTTSCKWLKSRFLNVEIPKECRVDKEKYIEIKTWIKNNKTLSFKELNDKFKKKFNYSENLINIELENSGNIDVDNYKIKEEIKKCYTQLRFNFNEEISKKINAYRYAPKSSIDKIQKSTLDEKFHKPIMDLHKAKYLLKNIIIDIYRMKYNPNLAFNSTILDSIGFNRCRGKDCFKISI